MEIRTPITNVFNTAATLPMLIDGKNAGQVVETLNRLAQEAKAMALLVEILYFNSDVAKENLATLLFEVKELNPRTPNTVGWYRSTVKWLSGRTFTENDTLATLVEEWDNL